MCVWIFQVPKLGVMLVGMGGNNGSTVMAAILANKYKMKWHTKEGVKEANYFGKDILKMLICIYMTQTFKSG